MRKLASIIGSAIFLLIAPGVVAGFVPWWISRWHLGAPFLELPPIRIAGAILLTLGILGVLDSFTRFALKGEGTPAPIFPTRHLVVTGLYRYVRNPMYVSLVSAILGQAMIFGNVQLLEYGGFVWLSCHIFVLLYEEPVLRETFGPEYQSFCAHVPRWIPRLKPWRAS